MQVFVERKGGKGNESRKWAVSSQGSLVNALIQKIQTSKNSCRVGEKQVQDRLHHTSPKCQWTAGALYSRGVPFCGGGGGHLNSCMWQATAVRVRARAHCGSPTKGIRDQPRSHVAPCLDSFTSSRLHGAEALGPEWMQDQLAQTQPRSVELCRDERDTSQKLPSHGM